MTTSILPGPPASRMTVSDDALFEIVRGLRQEKKPMGVFAGKLASMLCHLLTSFVSPRKLGLAVNEVLFVLDAAIDLKRRPDVAFVSNARWVGDDPESDGAWNTVPDLAVEVVSPSNTSVEIDRKVVEYFAAGVRSVWVLFPETRRLHVYDSAEQMRVVGATGLVEGGLILPGFQLKLGDLFAAVEKPVV